MDNAVAIVQAYLRLNGYFTITEFPIIEAMHSGGHRVVTDLDVLAFRFPDTARVVPKHGRSNSRGVALSGPDPALNLKANEADMIVGEVKEGRAELNRGARNPAVLQAVLTRFGCCAEDESQQVVEDLIRHGAAKTHCDHNVRLFAFGSSVAVPHKNFAAIELGHMVSFLSSYLRRHWDVLHHAEFKDPVLGVMATFMKAGASWTMRDEQQNNTSKG